MGIRRAVLTTVLMGYVLLLAARAEADSHHKEHYKPDKHLLREKKAKEHHTYFHNEKQNIKQIRKSYKLNGPHHEEKMQRDMADPHERQSDAWHRKDVHLQEMNHGAPKEHHSGHNPHHPKPHHPEHHSGKHGEHHKVKDSSTEHGYLHKPHKATPSTFEEKENMLSKSQQHSAKEHNHGHNKEESHQIHFPNNKKAKYVVKDQGWSKNKKQKDKKANHEKKQKQKQHHKKINQGELHKLW